jgi:hypothetical protein
VLRPLLGLQTRTVRETATLARGVPVPRLPDLPPQPDWPTILAYAASLCLIGQSDSQSGSQ